jgi:hypothetical protein
LKHEIKRRVLSLSDDEGVDPIVNRQNPPVEVAEDEYRYLFDDMDEYNEYVDENHALRINDEQDIRTIVDAQLSMYWNAVGMRRLSIVGGKTVINNPLTWWLVNGPRFPLVAKLARRVLCIPATSAPSERLFSQAGITIAKDRANLLPENAATLIFLQDCWEMADNYLRENM